MSSRQHKAMATASRMSHNGLTAGSPESKMASVAAAAASRMSRLMRIQVTRRTQLLFAHRPQRRQLVSNILVEDLAQLQAASS